MYRIEPILDEDLIFSKDEIPTPHGEIVSRWIIEEKHFFLSVSVPAGICCEVKMPDGSENVLKSGKHKLHCQL